MQTTLKLTEHSIGRPAVRRLICVDPKRVADIWPMVADMIDAAYAALDEPTPDVLAWLRGGGGLLWIYTVDDEILAAVTTSIIEARRGLALRCVACGADTDESAMQNRDAWRVGMAEIERYARAQRCYKIVFEGRRGWSRILPGYDPVSVTLAKRI